MGTFVSVHRSMVPKNAKIHKCKFVYDVKVGPAGELIKFKARLVFVGAGQHPSSYEAVYANTVRYASVRSIMALGAMWDDELFNVDIRGAYLYSDMDKELYMCEPPGHETLDEEATQATTWPSASRRCMVLSRVRSYGVCGSIRGYAILGLCRPCMTSASTCYGAGMIT